MKRIGTLMACGALALAFSACDDGRTGDPDGGPIVLRDSGSDPDSGPVAVDAGTDAGETDTCPPQMAPAPQMPMACAAATLTCLMGAATAEAQQACIEADPNAENCNGCILEDIAFTCTNPPTSPCADQFGELQCCLNEECSATPTEACFNAAIGTATSAGPCTTVANAFFMCTNTAQMARSCGVTQACFQTGS